MGGFIHLVRRHSPSQALGQLSPIRASLSILAKDLSILQRTSLTENTHISEYLQSR